MTGVRRRRTAAAIAASLIAAAAAPASAPAVDRFYPRAARSPNGLVRGPDGAIWYTAGRSIGRLAPDGTTRRFAVGAVGPDGIATVTPGPDGNLWFTLPDRRKIGQLTPAGVVTEFGLGLPRRYRPHGIVAGPGGNLWITANDEAREGRILRMSVHGEVTPVAKVPGDDNAYEIVAGADERMWFVTDFSVGSVGSDGRVTVYPEQTDEALGGEFADIAAAADGTVWAAGVARHRLLRVDPDGVLRQIRTWGFPGAVLPLDDRTVWVATDRGLFRLTRDGRIIQRVSDTFGNRSDCSGGEDIDPFSGNLAIDGLGQLWAADWYHDGLLRVTTAPGMPPGPLSAVLPRARMGRPQAFASGRDAVWMSTQRGELVRFGADGEPVVVRRLGAGRRAVDLAVQRDGTVWFGTLDGAVGRLSPAGRLRRFRRGLPRKAQLGGVGLDRKGRVWLTGTGFVARVTPSTGRIRVLRRGLRRRDDLMEITQGPRGSMWFTASNRRYGRIDARGRIRVFTHPNRRSNPVGIAQGADGNLWFTDFVRNRIVRVSPRGRILREYRTIDTPAAIVPGPDGALWFTSGANEWAYSTRSGLGRIDLRGRVRRFYVRATCVVAPLALTAAPDGSLWFGQLRGPVAVGRFVPW